MKFSVKVLLCFFALTTFANAAEYFKCVESDDPSFGFMLRTTDKPVGYRRYSAMIKNFQLCSYATLAREEGCRSLFPERGSNYESVYDCGRKRISLYSNLRGEVATIRTHGHSRKQTADIQCTRLSSAAYSRERVKLSHCKE